MYVKWDCLHIRSSESTAEKKKKKNHQEEKVQGSPSFSTHEPVLSLTSLPPIAPNAKKTTTQEQNN
jgi:hypothetical protein